MNDEFILRKQAVELHLQGIAVIDIAGKLNKTRQWVYKWIKRYETGDKDWFCSRSNAPKKSAKRIPNQIEQTIVSIRQNLKGNKYAQKGALNILYEFQRLNIIPPSIATINRVIKRNNLLEERDSKAAKKKIIRIISVMFSKWIYWGQNISKAASDITF